eukprot:CAMPEP_0173420132 /NCGR_PEP_ID=MMETSP1357-20121228/1739_1 /TAXON_ID=77926 /ORGANISM="Hemiselmis rufescens, Strain PCC563" /LENGTH=34 /DNA_ID= /DNA_START= /DNA_END= /DNA_ORIENTATION=
MAYPFLQHKKARQKHDATPSEGLTARKHTSAPPP